MSVFDHPEFANHEQIIFVSDREAGLRAIIAMHDRTLGPAIGGTRLYPYESERDALADVLRLSKGMTYKNALAGLPFGGGKSVIIADPSEKTPELLRAFARAVDGLAGQYWTGEDVNVGSADVETLASVTPYLLGRTRGETRSGDPSPFTAGGCFSAMKASLRHVFSSNDLRGRRVAIQGVGSVGYQLARLVAGEGGSLVVSDVRSEATARVAEDFGAEVVDHEAIYDQESDVFSPCGMGGTIGDDTIPRLRCKIVCGAANNQLATPSAGRRLLDRAIAYAPDYVVNAGGILNAAGDFFGRYDVEEVWKRVNAIGDTVSNILERADRDHRPTHEVADEMAEARLAAARQAAN
jgi:leucine dehydrogenase